SQRPGAVGRFVPIEGTAGTSIVSGDNPRLSIGHIAKLKCKFFQIPAPDLDVTFRVAQDATRGDCHLWLEFSHPGLRGPFPAHDGGDLHQPNLPILTDLPGTEVGFFVDDAPDKIRVDAVDLCLASNDAIIAMYPVLVEKIAG